MEQTDPALSIEDLQAALRDMPTAMDMTSADLQTLYTLAQHHARARRATAGVVQAIMTTAVVTLPPEADLQTAAQVLSEHQISGAPGARGGRGLPALARGAGGA